MDFESWGAIAFFNQLLPYLLLGKLAGQAVGEKLCASPVSLSAVRADLRRDLPKMFKEMLARALSERSYIRAFQV